MKNKFLQTEVFYALVERGRNLINDKKGILSIYATKKQAIKDAENWESEKLYITQVTILRASQFLEEVL